MAGTTPEESRQTLDLLGERLNRVNYLVNGDIQDSRPSTPTISQPAASRLRQMTQALNNLAARHHAVAQVLNLQEQHPEVLNPPGTIFRSNFSTPSLAQLVLAHELLYRQSASQLQLLQGLSIPPSSESVKLVDQQDRLEKAEVRESELVKEVQELRSRSARALEHWYEGGVLGMGERWTEWEERLRDVEIRVRRREAVKRRDEMIA